MVSEHAEPIVFHVLGEGSFFGEISVVLSCPRTASVRCAFFCINHIFKEQKNSSYFGSKRHALEMPTSI